jgi:hypothetical protein
MNGVAATLLAIGLCAAYGTAERAHHDSAKRIPVDRQIADDTTLRGTRRGWLNGFVGRREKRR